MNNTQTLIFKRKNDDTMENKDIEFEKLENRKTRKFKMELPESVSAFKLLDGACLQHENRQLVITGVNYAEVVTMFNPTRVGLFLG